MRSSARHTSKKPFQPDYKITDYFSRGDPSLASSNGASDSLRRHQHSLAPSDQASLLSVGMRIRKAVPEGYKTHKTRLMNNEENEPPVNLVGDSLAYETSPQAPAFRPQNNGSRGRELLPFCGIHKIGGLGFQESSNAGVDAFNVSGDSNFSSQESQISNMSTGSVRHVLQPGKRRFEDNEDADDEEEDGILDFDFSLRISAPVESRKMAKARSRVSVRQEQSTFVFNRGVDAFPEADFLRPLDDEVDMGGM